MRVASLSDPAGERRSTSVAARVVVLGLANLDHRFWVERFPPNGGRTRASEYRQDLGGPAAVGARTVARLGGEAVFFGWRGDDEAGRLLEGFLRADGVDTEGYRVFPGTRTPTSSVLIDPEGERTIFHYPGTAQPDDPDWLRLESLRGAQAVLLDARWAAGSLQLARAARARDIPVVLDLDRDTDEAWAVAGLATHVLADAEMAERSGGTSPLIDRLLGLGTWPAVTQGAAGVVHESGRVPAFAMTVSDTTGAGDVFHGAFALALAEGKSEEEALRQGAAAAALRSSLADVPRRDQLEALLKSGG